MDSSMLRVPLASSDGCGVLIHTSTPDVISLAELHVTFYKDQDRFIEIRRHVHRRERLLLQHSTHDEPLRREHVRSLKRGVPGPVV